MRFVKFKDEDLIKITSANKYYTLDSMRKKLKLNGFVFEDGWWKGTKNTQGYRIIVGLLLEYGIIEFSAKS